MFILSAIGLHITRYLLDQVRYALKDTLRETDFAFRPAGSQVLPMAIQLLLQQPGTERMLLKVDVQRAFDVVRREFVLGELARVAPSLVPLVS